MIAKQVSCRQLTLSSIVGPDLDNELFKFVECDVVRLYYFHGSELA